MQTNSCVLVRSEEIKRALQSPAQQGTHALEPIKSIVAATGFPVKILEDHQVRNRAEVHLREGDLWLCLEGEVNFRYGGTLVLPQQQSEYELKGDEIEGGTDVVLKPGDWLWIPAGQPHQHWTDSTARLAITKIPQQ